MEVSEILVVGSMVEPRGLVHGEAIFPVTGWYPELVFLSVVLSVSPYSTLVVTRESQFERGANF